MKTFLVGGAVRDQLLNYPVTEKDWVVIGETPESMLSNDFQQVGKDFPVFLHPKTREEYALARTERKTAVGYTGFKVYSDPNVTLEADLIRRDLTINAMAMDATGAIIDPYNGQQDLKQRIFRHVSPAFSEDPVRILRVARFAAKYAHLGFKIAPETLELMRSMVLAGETAHLVAERVWAELHKALLCLTPVAFFESLQACNALAVIFPEIQQLFGVPQPAKHHPEIDTGIHSFMCLQQASKLSAKAEVRLATLLHDLGKAVTPVTKLPKHHGHEQAGLPILAKFCQRLRIPTEFTKLAKLVMQYHTHCHTIMQLRPQTLVNLLEKLGVFSQHHNHLDNFIVACTADAQGRLGYVNTAYPQADYLNTAAQIAQTIEVQAILALGFTGKNISLELRRQRITAIKNWKSQQTMQQIH